MRIKAIISLIALLLCSTMIMAQPGLANDDPIQEKLQSVLDSGNRADLESYRRLLVELEKAKLQAKDQAGATSAKLGIIKIDRELADLEESAARSGKATVSGTDREAAAQKAAAERAAAQKDAAEKAAAQKAAAERAAAQKAAAEKAAAENAAAAKATALKAAMLKAAAVKAAQAKAAAEKIAADKLAAERAAAEKAAAEKAAAVRAAAEKLAAERAAAAKAAAEKIAAEKAAAEKLAAEKAAAEKAAAENAAEKAAAEKAAAENAAAEEAKAEQARQAAELDKKLKELIAEGNARLSAGDIQKAREIKKEIGKVRVAMEQLSAAGVTIKTAQPAPKADNSDTGTGFSSAELQNYKNILKSWKQERNEALAQDGANRKKVLEDYRQKLVAYGDALLVTNNIPGASAVKDEITTLTLDMDELK